MKNVLWLFVGFAVAYYFIVQKYGTLTSALAAWQPTVQTVVSTSQPALASNGQGSGSLAPESSFYATSLPNSYYPVPPGSGNNAHAVGAGHVNPVNNVRKSISPLQRSTGGPVKAPTLTPVATGRQFVTTKHSVLPSKVYPHSVIGPVGTGSFGVQNSIGTA